MHQGLRWTKKGKSLEGKSQLRGKQMVGLLEGRKQHHIRVVEAEHEEQAS
jgi:hypothetical protein